jgi:hypothetical protein
MQAVRPAKAKYRETRFPSISRASGMRKKKNYHNYELSGSHTKSQFNTTPLGTYAQTPTVLDRF